jgi:EPS-associated MarR family transcriptional regulator
MPEEIHYHVLKHIESNPSITQRELAKELGVSVGKVNYCLKALIDKGWIKANNFKNSNKKLAYFYILTPSGLEQKAKITVNFLKRKINDYEELKKEIEVLKNEVNNNGITDPD